MVLQHVDSQHTLAVSAASGPVILYAETLIADSQPTTAVSAVFFHMCETGKSLVNTLLLFLLCSFSGIKLAS
jgi:hypothetical protein